MSTIGEAQYIAGQLRELRSKLPKEEPDDIEYRNWCDGILSAAIAALGVLTGNKTP